MNKKFSTKILMIFSIVCIGSSLCVIYYFESNAKNQIDFGSNIYGALNTPEMAMSLIQVSNAQEFQNALFDVPDKGVIELESGTYDPSGISYYWDSATSSGDYFRIPENTQKHFIIRAVDGALPEIAGGLNTGLMRNINSDISQSGWIVFEGITFRDGYSSVDGIAGGLTLHYANATFINCVFKDNYGQQPTTGGGGILVALESTAIFSNTSWYDNIAKNEGGGIAVNDFSKVYIHNANFARNRTNVEPYRDTAAGGAIHVGNSILRVSNSLFDSNEAASIGGAIYAIRLWPENGGGISHPEGDILISNSSFINNRVSPGTIFSEGGAIHFEDQITGKIYNSRFVQNSAEEGGGLNLYRAVAEVYDSVFLGNSAIGSGSATGFGGAISAISNDVQSIDGNINRRSAKLTVENSFIIGRYGPVDTVGQVAGGIYIAGDSARVYGLNGTTPIGSVNDNRAIGDLNNVVFFDTDVVETSGVSGTGMGGGMLGDLITATITNSMFINADAFNGGNGWSSGGGLALINQSVANIGNTTFAGNRSERLGGALFISSSDVDLIDCELFENQVVFSGQSLGSVLFLARDSSLGIIPRVILQDSVVSNNDGLPIFEDIGGNYLDSELYVTGVSFYSEFQDGAVTHAVYVNPYPPYTSVDAVGLNALGNGNHSGNQSLAIPVSIGILKSNPTQVLSVAAPGEDIPLISYLTYAWSGSTSAMIEGTTIVSSTGYLTTTSPGTYTLNLSNPSLVTSVNVLDGQEPGATVEVASDQLIWNVTTGTFLENIIDNNMAIVSSSSGSKALPTNPDTSYRMYVIMEEGGVFISCDIYPFNIYLPLLFR